jgi:hypothetical protein
VVDSKPPVQEIGDFRQCNITVRAFIYLRMQRDHDRLASQ